jgi:hypothetical protein
MCKAVHVLAFHDSGYVVQCRQCEMIQFAFGTTIATLTENQFDEFRVRLEKHTDELNVFENCCKEKSIQLAIVNNSMMIGLTPFEANSLLRLLSEAKAGLEVNKLLHDE